MKSFVKGNTLVALLKALFPQRVKQTIKKNLLGAISRENDSLREKLSELEARTAALQTQIPAPKANDDADVRLQQIEAILKREHSVALPPPKHLQERVVGVYVGAFIESGWGTYEQLSRFLAPNNLSLSQFQTILDFGCGCGRILRGFRSHLPSASLYGCDIDGEAIVWLQENYKSIAEFETNPHLPPMTYGSNMFDFIYSISIFTHLPVDMQFAWLEELQRIAKPGAYLVLTTHGDIHRNKLSPVELAKLNANGIYYREAGALTDGLPGFYRTTYHTPDYIRNVWSKYFDVLALEPHGLDHHQDMILLRKRGG